MQLPKEVIIKVRPDGRVELETFGFVGKSCSDLSTLLEKILGAEDGDGEDVCHEYKPEYYLNENTADNELDDRAW